MCYTVTPTLGTKQVSAFQNISAICVYLHVNYIPASLLKACGVCESLYGRLEKSDVSAFCQKVRHRSVKSDTALIWRSL